MHPQIARGLHPHLMQCFGRMDSPLVELFTFGFQLRHLLGGSIQILDFENGFVSPCDHIGQFRPPPAHQLIQFVDAPVKPIQILYAALTVQLLDKREHHVGKIGRNGFQSRRLLGEHAADLDAVQCLCRAVHQIDGRGRIRSFAHLRGVQHCQCG